MEYSLIGGLVVALIITIFRLRLENKRIEAELEEFERRSREHAVRMAQRVAEVHQEYAEKDIPNPKNRVDFE